MASTHLCLIVTITLFHSSLALLLSTFPGDKEGDRQRLLTQPRTWSTLGVQDHGKEIGAAESGVPGEISTEIGDTVTGFEGKAVTDLKKTTIEKPVLRKCCNFGEQLTPEGCLKSSSGGPPFRPVVYYNVTYPIEAPLDDLFALVFGDTCLHGRYRLDPSTEPEDEFYLLNNGSLMQPTISTVFNDAQEFCMEGFFKDEESHGDENSVVLPLICFPPPYNEEPGENFIWILYPVGLLISVPFLFIVLIAHILIPKLHRTLNGKCLISHITFLIIAYVSLASIQLSRRMIPNGLCIVLAFIVQFSFIASFCWLSAMCFNIWRIISNMPTLFSTAESTPRSYRTKLCIMYAIFALVIPLIIISVSLVMDLTPSIPASFLKPQFGVRSCWFLTDVAALPYFYGPITALIMVNVILFVLTAREIIQKSIENTNNITEGSRIQIIKEENKALKVCFSLFILMGVNWTMEIISWAAGNQGGMVLKSVWYFTDLCNALQGLFIFIIFILDSEFRSLVKKKLSTWGHCKSSSEESDETDIQRKNHYTMTSLLLSPQHPSR